MNTINPILSRRLATAKALQLPASWDEQVVYQPWSITTEYSKSLNIKSSFTSADILKFLSCNRGFLSVAKALFGNSPMLYQAREERKLRAAKHSNSFIKFIEAGKNECPMKDEDFNTITNLAESGTGELSLIRGLEPAAKYAIYGAYKKLRYDLKILFHPQAAEAAKSIISDSINAISRDCGNARNIISNLDDAIITFHKQLGLKENDPKLCDLTFHNLPLEEQ